MDFVIMKGQFPPYEEPPKARKDWPWPVMVTGDSVLILRDQKARAKNSLRAYAYRHPEKVFQTYRADEGGMFVFRHA